MPTKVSFQWIKAEESYQDWRVLITVAATCVLDIPQASGNHNDVSQQIKRCSEAKLRVRIGLKPLTCIPNQLLDTLLKCWPQWDTGNNNFKIKAKLTMNRDSTSNRGGMRRLLSIWAPIHDETGSICDLLRGIHRRKRTIMRTKERINWGIPSLSKGYPHRASRWHREILAVVSKSWTKGQHRGSDHHSINAISRSKGAARYGSGVDINQKRTVVIDVAIPAGSNLRKKEHWKMEKKKKFEGVYWSPKWSQRQKHHFLSNCESGSSSFQVQHLRLLSRTILLNLNWLVDIWLYYNFTYTYFYILFTLIIIMFCVFSSLTDGACWIVG